MNFIMTIVYDVAIQSALVMYNTEKLHIVNQLVPA